MQVQSLTRLLVPAVIGLTLLGGGCKKANKAVPPVDVKAPSFFAPAADSKHQVVASVVVPSIAETIKKVEAIGAKLQLLQTGGGAEKDKIRDMVGGALGLPNVVWTHLDASKPIGIAALANKPDPEASATAMAAQAKTAKDAQALVAALGEKLGEQDGATHIKRASGDELWVYLHDDEIILSDSLADLKAAGAHALAARRKVDEDVLATFFFEALAKARGTTVRQKLDEIRSAVLNAQRQQAVSGSPLSPEVSQKLVAAFVDPFLDPLADTQAGEVALIVSEKEGLILRGRAHPKPGSAFANSLKTVVPTKLDPAVSASPLTAGLFATHYGPDILKRFVNAFDAVAELNTPGAKSFGQGMNGLLKDLSGDYSGTFSAEGGFNYSFVGNLAEGVDANDVMDHLEAAMGPQGLGLMMKDFAAATEAPKKPGKGSRGAAVPALVWKRQQLTARVEVPLITGLPAAEQARMQRLMGGNKWVYNFAIVGNKFLGVIAPRPEAEMARLSAAVAGDAANQKPHASVQQILEETKGSEGFMYLDLLGIIRPFIAAAAGENPQMAQANAVMGMVPGLSQLSLPMIFTYKGGDNLGVTWAVPMRAFEAVASAVRPFLGFRPQPGAPHAP